MDRFSISTTCRQCGTVTVDPNSLRIHLNDDTVSYFSCSCPGCLDTLGGTVGTEVARSLVSRGVAISEIPFSVEILERPQGTPFSLDDVLDFHQLLEGDDWFEELTEEDNFSVGTDILRKKMS